MRILLETGTESERVAQALEAAGHEVVVADPNYVPMYGELPRKVKTDRRDVAALAEANRRGWYRARIGRRRPSARRDSACAPGASWCRCERARSVCSDRCYGNPAIGCRPGDASVPARLARVMLPTRWSRPSPRSRRLIAVLTTEIRWIDLRLKARVAAIRSSPRLTDRAGCRPGRGDDVPRVFDTVDRFTMRAR